MSTDAGGRIGLALARQMRVTGFSRPVREPRRSTLNVNSKEFHVEIKYIKHLMRDLSFVADDW